MQQLQDVEAVRRWCDEQRRAGRRVGFVPTMGYLHEGHLSLIRQARQHADSVVVSIFVNPTQFGPQEDLGRYPRDAEGDAAKCREAGVDLIFSPSVEAMYPAGAQTFVEVQGLSQGLCGERRPGHFRGVCTIVEKLFNVIGPCVAVFGEKDYQQLQVLRRLVADLLQPVEIVAGPLVREADGLAMSSRNAYLDADQRRAAVALHQTLCAARDRVAGAEAPLAKELLALARGRLEAVEGARIDYVELRRRESLEPLAAEAPVRAGEAVLLLAVFFGATRLIDNLSL
jgi:pantoate--beta-alanine ligase